METVCAVRAGDHLPGGAVSVISFQMAVNVTLSDYREKVIACKLRPLILHVSLKFYFSRTIPRGEKQVQTLALVIA